MNKIGMVLGAAALVTLAGCKDPDYKYDNAPDSQGDVQMVGEAPRADEKPIEVKPIAEAPVAPEAVAPAPKPIAPEAVAPAPKPVAPVVENTSYIVKSGDSLSRISKRHNVTISSIKRLNPGIKGDRIRIGQRIKLPGKFDVGQQAAPAAAPAAKKIGNGAIKEYIVKNGDSLGAIALSKGISVRQLKEMNGLKKDTIRIGQKLKVPAEKVIRPAVAAGKKAVERRQEKKVVKAEAKKTAEAAKKPEAAKPAEQKPAADAAAPAAEAPVAAPAAEPAPAAAEPAPAAEPEAAPAAQAPAKTANYTVQEGDDMTGVSIRWGVSAAEIRQLNNLGENDTLKPGQVIRLPADAQQ